MNILSKRTLIPMAAVAILGAGAIGAVQASAASSPSAIGQSLVQQIASKFGLDPAKVQAVFDQNRAAKQATQETNYEDRLSKAVTAGTLTSSQKDAILAENTKLKAEITAAGSDNSARRTAMKNVRAEAKTWAAQNNISERWLMAGIGGHPRGGMDTSQAPSPTATPQASSQVN